MVIATPPHSAAIPAVKSRARHLARRPATLDVLHPGLSRVGPNRLIAIGLAFVARERRADRFGRQIGPINAKAIVLLGRTLRRNAARGADARSVGSPPLVDSSIVPR